MKPYYQDEWVTIYHGDCLEVLPLLQPNSVDLILTSPPYSDMRDYGNGWRLNKADTFAALNEVSRDGGVCVWVEGDQTINCDKQLLPFQSAMSGRASGYNLLDIMIYGKVGTNYPSKYTYPQSFEFMLIFSKGQPKTFNPILRKTKNKSSMSSFRQKDGTLKWKYVELHPETPIDNVWYFDVGFQKSTKELIAYQHPAIFPDDLASAHIVTWTQASDVVLDPFLGSGTTAKQAKKLNRKCIGIEIEEKYCEIAAKRCSQSVMRLDI